MLQPRRTISSMLLFTKIMHTAMTLWQNNEIQRFQADTNSSVRKRYFNVFVEIFRWNQIEYARITIIYFPPICDSYSYLKARPQVIKHFLCSTHLSMKLFILLMNVDILTFKNRINTTHESFKARKIFIFQHWSFNEQLKFHAQLSWAWKSFIISVPVLMPSLTRFLW